jgi:hypothetical protein
MNKAYMLIKLIIVLILFSSISYSALSADEIDLYDAEINAYIQQSGGLPSIKLSNWTSINVSIDDTFSMNWTYFQEEFFNDNEPIKKAINKWWWNKIFKNLDAPVQSFLGYTSLKFKPIILSENPKGWHVRIIPSTIVNTTTGKKHTITIETQVDDSVVDYSAIIRVNCTRIDTLGNEYGYSYIDIPVKVLPSNYLKSNVKDTVRKMGLNNISKIKISITNEGYYKDIFHFVVNESGEIDAKIDNQILVLEAGETKTIVLNVLSPERFIDFGTPSFIDIFAYSDSDKNLIQVGSINIITQGVFISPLYIIILSIFAIIFILIITVLYYIKFRKKKKITIGNS